MRRSFQVLRHSEYVILNGSAVSFTSSSITTTAQLLHVILSGVEGSRCFPGFFVGGRARCFDKLNMT